MPLSLSKPKHFSKKNNKKKRKELPKRNKTQKRCYLDDELKNICKTGKFTAVNDEGIYRPENIAKFEKMTAQLNKMKALFTRLMMRRMPKPSGDQGTKIPQLG